MAEILNRKPRIVFVSLIILHNISFVSDFSDRFSDFSDSLLPLVNTRIGGQSITVIFIQSTMDLLGFHRAQDLHTHPRVGF